MDKHISHMCLNSSSTSILEALSTWVSILAMAPHAWLSLDLHQVFSNMEKKRLDDIHPIHDATTHQQVFSHFPNPFLLEKQAIRKPTRLQTAPCGRRWSHLAAHPRWPNNHRHPATWDFVHTARWKVMVWNGELCGVLPWMDQCMSIVDCFQVRDEGHPLFSFERHDKSWEERRVVELGTLFRRLN